MRIVLVIAFVALLASHAGTAFADQSTTLGDIVVRYSAISTDQLFDAVAKRYGIERSTHRGLVNIAIEPKSGGEMIAASVSGSFADLTGHSQPIRFRETRDEGAIDYLGEFPVDASGTYVFTINVTPTGRVQPYTIKFHRDYVLD